MIAILPEHFHSSFILVFTQLTRQTITMKNSTAILALCLLLSLVSLYHTNIARSHEDSELFTLNNRFLDVKYIYNTKQRSTQSSDATLCEEYKVYLWGYYCSSQQDAAEGDESCPVVPLDDLDLVYLYGTEVRKNKQLQDVRYVDINLPLDKGSWIHLSREAGRTADVLYWAQVIAECTVFGLIGGMLFVQSMLLKVSVFITVGLFSYKASVHVHEAGRYLEHILVVIIEKFNYSINDQSIKVFHGSQLYHSVSICDTLFMATGCLSIAGVLVCVFELVASAFDLEEPTAPVQQTKRGTRRQSRERSTTGTFI